MHRPAANRLKSNSWKIWCDLMSDELKARVQTYLPVIFLIVLVLLVGAYDPSFFSLDNFLSVTADTMTLFLMASGVTFVIIIGGIDLSIQAVASMASCILAAYLDALRYLDDPACGSRRRGCGFCRQHRLDQAADSLLHRHACRQRRRDCRPVTGFRARVRSIFRPIFRPAICSGRSATRWAFPMRSGSAQS